MTEKGKNDTTSTTKLADHEQTIEQRIAHLITILGGQYQVARLTERSPGSVNNWRKNAQRMAMRDILVLAREAGVSLDWIATGYGSRPVAPPTEGAGVEYARIAVYGPSGNNTLAELGFQPPAAFLRGWLDEAGIAPESCAVIMVQDDGMAPEIGPGDMVLVDRARATIESSGVYALLRQSAVLVRRVQVMVDGGVLIIPANSLYKRETFTAEAATGLPVAGRVRAVLKMM